MRLLWLSHQFAASTPQPKRTGLLPGLYAGGAEMSTEEMLAQAPEGVEVVRHHLPLPLPNLDEFDLIVVGATEHLKPAAQTALLPYRPVVWVRSPQQSWRMELFRAARLMVWPSHECARWHSWFDLSYEICPAPMDVSAIPRDGVKENVALWAGRNIWHKNPEGARKWAEERGIPFRAVTDADRETVLAEMAKAKYFVHLPKNIIDPCPRTVIEAQIAGCEIVTNELCGRVPGDTPDEVAEFVSGAGERFWEWTLNA